MTRQVILDTETTGINKNRRNGDVCKHHRIVEISCVELIDKKPTGRYLHEYLNPEQQVDPKAISIHGLTNEFLKDKPKFSEISDKLIDFIKDAEVIIHNAPFDTAFLDKEFRNLPSEKQPKTTFLVTDTLAMARMIYPGERNTLDELCNRFNIAGRNGKHNALEDTRLLSQIYLKLCQHPLTEIYAYTRNHPPF